MQPYSFMVKKLWLKMDMSHCDATLNLCLNTPTSSIFDNIFIVNACLAMFYCKI